MSGVVAPAWQVIDPGDSAWAHWGDGQHIVYHRPSGQTHFLNDASACLLRDVLLEPRTAAQAGEALAERQQAASTPEFVLDVTGTLVRLEELGLLRRHEA